MFLFSPPARNQTLVKAPPETQIPIYKIQLTGDSLAVTRVQVARNQASRATVISDTKISAFPSPICHSFSRCLSMISLYGHCRAPHAATRLSSLNLIVWPSHALVGLSNVPQPCIYSFPIPFPYPDCGGRGSLWTGWGRPCVPCYGDLLSVVLDPITHDQIVMILIRIIINHTEQTPG